MRNGIVKIETNFLGKNQTTKLDIEPTTFRATAKHATYCTTEATSSHNLKFFIIFSQFWQFYFSWLLKDFLMRFFYDVGAWLRYQIMFKSNLYLIGKTEKSWIKKLQSEKFAYQKKLILNIFIGSEAESPGLSSPTKNRIENDRLDDVKP